MRDAERHPVGSDAWWESVGRARVANDEHMAEEEREALADFRRKNSPFSSTPMSRVATGDRLGTS